MQARLNSFQRTMLQWNDLHPYNAVHVARWPGVVDAERLRESIQARVAAWELAVLRIDRSRRTYQTAGHSSGVEIEWIRGQDDPEQAMCRETERQLNTPFSIEPPGAPVRFFAVPAASSFFLGLVYLHAIADAGPVVRLMRQIGEGYQGRGAEGKPALAPGGVAAWQPAPGALRLALRMVAALPRRVQAMRACCRPPLREPRDMTNRWLSFRLDDREVGALMAAARGWGVTVNDVVLALLLGGVARLAPARRWTSSRKRLAVGCIVNTRSAPPTLEGSVMDLSLGSFCVTHEVPGGMSLRDLAREVGEQTIAIKRRRLDLASSIELALGRWLWAASSLERRRTFYRKHYPLWGGLTNLNLNRLWDPADPTAPLEYVRAASTGPATPLVLSLTTTGREARVGVTYRPAVFHEHEAGDLAGEIRRQVAALSLRS